MRVRRTMVTWFAFLPRPMRKLSGLMSLCKKPLVCTYSISVICDNQEANYISNRPLNRY